MLSIEALLFGGKTNTIYSFSLYLVLEKAQRKPLVSSLL